MKDGYKILITHCGETTTFDYSVFKSAFEDFISLISTYVLVSDTSISLVCVENGSIRLIRNIIINGK